MFLATELVKQGEVGAMVSAGNTGALLMVGRHLLKTLDGIQKPAIVATIPGAMNQSYLLDVGANPECDRQQLFEFAVMGSALAESLNGESVSVGLLNIGAEEYKGTNEVQQAGKMLEDCDAVNYIGFVEANDLFDGAADVVVCDGFVGNVTIKSSAGVANVINKLLEAQIRESMLSRLSGYAPIDCQPGSCHHVAIRYADCSIIHRCNCNFKTIFRTATDSLHAEIWIRFPWPGLTKTGHACRSRQ